MTTNENEVTLRLFGSRTLALREFQQDVDTVTKPESRTSGFLFLVFELEQGHPLVLECISSKNKVKVRLNYDPSYLEPIFANSMLLHLCKAMELISLNGGILCRDIDLFGHET